LAPAVSLVGPIRSHTAPPPPRLSSRSLHARAVIQPYHTIPYYTQSSRHSPANRSRSSAHSWDCYFHMYCTCSDTQLPHTGKHHEPTVRPSTEKLSAGASVLTIAETGRISCASTATIKPNIPQNLFKDSAQAQILRNPPILIDKWLWVDENCISVTSSQFIQSRISDPCMDAASRITSRCESMGNMMSKCTLYG
jgi:hypothetical protein